MEYTSFEYYMVCLLHYVPFIVVFLTLFRHNFRFSHKVTFTILGITTFVYLAGNYFVEHQPSHIIQYFTYIEIILLIVIALLIIKAPASQMLFLALIQKNCADFIVIISKYLEHILWPDHAMLIYSWTYSVCTIICEICLFTTLFYFFKKKLNNFQMDNIDHIYWRYLWLVPLFFYILWIYVFYSSDTSSLELALKDSTCIFMLLSMLSQIYIYFCLAFMVQNYQHNADMHEELYAARIQAIQNEHISQQIAQTRTLRHDLRHHLILISSYLEEHDYSGLEQYIHQQVSKSAFLQDFTFCQNKSLNIMLVYYASLCRANQVDFSFELDIPKELGLDDSEITVLFGNLIENAFEACLHCESKHRHINMLGREIQNTLLFSISNSVPDDFVLPDTDTLMSSKRPEPGIGTESCKKIIRQHKGTIRWYQENDVIADFSFPFIPFCR